MKGYGHLIDAFLALQSPAEAKLFLRDLMTPKEIEEFSNRLQAAEMLTDNVPYTEIVKATGLSTTTIARVSLWLKSKGGGYRKIIQRLHSAKDSSKSRR